MTGSLPAGMTISIPAGTTISIPAGTTNTYRRGWAYLPLAHRAGLAVFSPWDII
jgi:hypothetical protein